MAEEKAPEKAAEHPAEARREKAIAKLIVDKKARSRAHAEFLIKTESVLI